MECPICGHEFNGPEFLLVEELSSATYEGEEFHLCPQEWSIMALLARHWPHVVPYDRLIFALYPADNEPDKAGDVVKIKLYYLRKKFLDIPVFVTTVWGRGVRLISPGKVKLVPVTVKSYEDEDDEEVVLLQKRRVCA